MESLDNLKYDTKISIKSKFEKLKRMSRSKAMLDVNFRLTQLKKLKAAFVKYEKEIYESNQKDLGASEFMTYFSSYSVVLRDIESIISNLYDWTAPRPVNTPVLIAPAKSYIIPEPLGINLIMSAWNSQYQTLIMPLAQSIAAGNVILAKPSEMSPATAYVCEKILKELDENVVEVVHGGGDVCEELLKYRYDIILFTGSPQKGVLVAKAAAEFLTPVILELGGQNPVIVDKTANVENCVYNIIYGRYLLAGQVCVAPEYVLIEREVFDKIVASMKTTVDKFFGVNPKNSKDFFRIVNTWHTERLAKLLSESQGKLLVTGEHDIPNRYIAPTIISYNSLEELSNSHLAKGEIFGPILYVAPYDNLDNVIDYINTKEKSLVTYYFGSDKKTKEKLIHQTSSGAFVTNSCIEYFLNEEMPFGGVGNSGYSAYHGITGFNNLSHLKPVMDKSQVLLKLRYPPYDNTKQKLIKGIMPISHLTQYKLLKIFLWTAVLLTLFYFKNNLCELMNLNIWKKR